MRWFESSPGCGASCCYWADKRDSQSLLQVGQSARPTWYLLFPIRSAATLVSEVKKDISSSPKHSYHHSTRSKTPQRRAWSRLNSLDKAKTQLSALPISTHHHHCPVLVSTPQIVGLASHISLPGYAMFANFEVCKAGLVTATPSRRHQRTSTGCLQCKQALYRFSTYRVPRLVTKPNPGRQRKKKCDERRPICSSCLKYGTTCERGRNSKHHSRARSSSGLPGESGPPSPSNALAQSPSSDFSAYSIDSHCSLSSELVPLDSTYPVTTHSRIQDSLVQERHWSDFEVSFLSMGSNVRSLELVAFNLSSEHRVLDFLLEKIEALIMPRYISPKLSILYIALPLAVASPAMKNALMACGFALLSQASSGTEDSIQAKSYQCKALNDLAGNLLEGLEEQNLATILLLHLFEVGISDRLLWQ